MSVIDTYGLSETELRDNYPEIYQYLQINLKPERDANRNKAIRENWWVHGRQREDMRAMLHGLNRYIATVETCKHRFFVFLDGEIVPDNKLICFGLADPILFGVFSSGVHERWALRNGAQLGPTPVYVKTRCFETFPFPDPDEATRARIRELGERLDAHRKRQQELHPDLTLTGIYNVLEKLRSGEELTDKERKIHDDGLVSVLKQIHDDLDEAVFHAYGWDDLYEQSTEADLDTDAWENELLERLVALNHERAAEEAAGKIRWLRPEFQNPDGDPETTQAQLAIPAAKKKVAAKVAKQKWPDRLTDQIATILALVPTLGRDPEILSQPFGRKSKKREAQIEQVIELLESLGKV